LILWVSPGSTYTIFNKKIEKLVRTFQFHTPEVLCNAVDALKRTGARDHMEMVKDSDGHITLVARLDHVGQSGPPQST
jgi:hypothetical protein